MKLVLVGCGVQGPRESASGDFISIVLSKGQTEGEEMEDCVFSETGSYHVKLASNSPAFISCVLGWQK